MTKRHGLRWAATGLLMATLPGLAIAAAYPEATITIVVPYAPGGSSDATARMVAKGLSKVLNQTVLVDNKAGAGGNIGAAYVAKAKADGYTLLFATSSHATNMALFKSPGFNLAKDFAPVSLVSNIPNVLVVQASSPASTLAEFVKLAAPADALNYGSAGNGSSSHLAAALFNKMANTRMQHIPFKGGALANQELLAGRIQAVFAPMVEVLPFIETGKLKALGVTTAKRSPRLPNVPAIAEVLPGYKAALWNALMAPVGTDPAIVDKLAKAVQETLRDPDVRKQLESQGTEAVGSTPQEFARQLPGEIADWAQVVQLSNATIE